MSALRLLFRELPVSSDLEKLQRGRLSGRSTGQMSHRTNPLFSLSTLSCKEATLQRLLFVFPPFHGDGQRDWGVNKGQWCWHKTISQSRGKILGSEIRQQQQRESLIHTVCQGQRGTAKCFKTNVLIWRFYPYISALSCVSFNKIRFYTDFSFFFFLQIKNSQSFLGGIFATFFAWTKQLSTMLKRILNWSWICHEQSCNNYSQSWMHWQV